MSLENDFKNPQDKYEDSSEKGDRVWSEFDKLRNEYRELIRIEEADEDEMFKIYDKWELHFRRLGPSLTGDVKENARLISEGMDGYRDEIAGIKGDIEGTRNSKKVIWRRIEELISELKKIGEID